MQGIRYKNILDMSFAELSLTAAQNILTNTGKFFDKLCDRTDLVLALHKDGSYSILSCVDLEDHIDDTFDGIAHIAGILPDAEYNQRAQHVPRLNRVRRTHYRNRIRC